VKTLGLVTIGQTPRPDLIDAFASHAPGVRVRVVGGLDGLSDDDLARLSPAPHDYPLLCRLRSGAAVEIAQAGLLPFIEDAAGRLARDGAGLIVLACAGDFPDIACAVPVLLPGRLLSGVASAISRTRRIGVVAPVVGQVPFAEAKWRRDGFQPLVAWASPFSGDETARAAEQLAKANVDLVVLDCMGHEAARKSELSRRCGLPVIAAQTTAARIAAEMLVE
jgi:protein AroM